MRSASLGWSELLLIWILIGLYSCAHDTCEWTKIRVDSIERCMEIDGCSITPKQLAMLDSYNITMQECKE